MRQSDAENLSTFNNQWRLASRTSEQSQSTVRIMVVEFVCSGLIFVEAKDLARLFTHPFMPDSY
jgi:hypothetical protein